MRFQRVAGISFKGGHFVSERGEFAELISLYVLVCGSRVFEKGRFRAGLVVKASRKSPGGRGFLILHVI